MKRAFKRSSERSWGGKRREKDGGSRRHEDIMGATVGIGGCVVITHVNAQPLDAIQLGRARQQLEFAIHTAD